MLPITQILLLTIALTPSFISSKSIIPTGKKSMFIGNVSQDGNLMKIKAEKKNSENVSEIENIPRIDLDNAENVEKEVETDQERRQEQEKNQEQAQEQAQKQAQEQAQLTQNKKLQDPGIIQPDIDYDYTNDVSRFNKVPNSNINGILFRPHSTKRTIKKSILIKSTAFLAMSAMVALAVVFNKMKHNIGFLSDKDDDQEDNIAPLSNDRNMKRTARSPFTNNNKNNKNFNFHKSSQSNENKRQRTKYHQGLRDSLELENIIKIDTRDLTVNINGSQCDNSVSDHWSLCRSASGSASNCGGCRLSSTSADFRRDSMDTSMVSEERAMSDIMAVSEST